MFTKSIHQISIKNEVSIITISCVCFYVKTSCNGFKSRFIDLITCSASLGR